MPGAFPRLRRSVGWHGSLTTQFCLPHSSTETLQFELSLPQFYALLRSMEQAQLQAGGA